MNEIIEALQKLKENVDYMRGVDGQLLHHQINSIIALASPVSDEAYETNAQRVRRIIAAGQYSI